MDVELLTWHASSGLVPESADDARLLAADSWLVDDGRARGLDLHRQRFARTCIASGGPATGELDEFWCAVIARLPRTGTWFPRIELAAGRRHPPCLRLRIRPAPERTAEARVWVRGGPDARRRPRHKGPDLGLLAALRHEGARAGAAEVLLTTGSGIVLEAANSSIVWWDGAALCVPDPALRVLPGVTVAMLRRRAAQCCIAVVHRRSRMSDLAGREVWLTNALHGIRPVVAWVGSTVPVGSPARAERWRQWWADCGEPLPGPARTGRA